MDPDQIRRRAPVLWLFMALLVVLVCVLGVLQYKWIGEISVDEQKQREYDLQAAANKLSSAFNAELATTAEAIQPRETRVQEMGRQKAYESRYSERRASAQHPRIVRRAGVVAQENSRLVLRMFNPDTGELEPVEWPAAWMAMKEFIASRVAGGNARNNGTPTLIDFPRFLPGAGRGDEQDWLLLDVDSKYAGEVILPELLAQQLGEDFRSQ